MQISNLSALQPKRKILHAMSSERLQMQAAPAETPGFLEFFAGSGLVAEGLKAQFKPLWANDVCAKKAAVYRANHGDGCFHLGSITEVRGEQLPRAVLAWASFPCQDLSLAGGVAGIHASRSGLVWEWLRIIDEMHDAPPVLVAENVAGLVSSLGGEHYRVLHRALVSRGYRVGAMLLNAERWVPQSRPRIFVVAVRAEREIPAQLMDAGPNWLHPRAVQAAAQGLEQWVWWRLPEPLRRRLNLSDIVDWAAPFADCDTEARHIALISPRHRKLLDAIPPGKNVVAPGYRRTRQGRQVLELRFDDISGCLRTPEGGSSRQLLVIRQEGELHSRLLTVREAARLMGAPDNYVLPGSYNDGYKAMGDAVAVPVAAWLAKHLLSQLVR